MGGGAEEVDWKDWRCSGGLPRGGKHPSEQVWRDCVCGVLTLSTSEAPGALFAYG